MHDIGALIWIALILIGVISSIRRNVQRARAAQQRATVAPPPPSAPAPPPAPARPAVTLSQFAMPPVPPPPAAPRIVIAPDARIVTPAAPPPLQAFPAPAPVGTSPIRGMFGGSTTLVRAIVAAEVLGQPKALQEQPIWSQRHSEPSI